MIEAPETMKDVTFNCPTVPLLKVKHRCAYHETTEHILCAQKELHRKDGPNFKDALTFYEHALALLAFIRDRCPESDGTWPFNYELVQWNYGRARIAYALGKSKSRCAFVPYHWEVPSWVDKGSYLSYDWANGTEKRVV